MSEKNNQSRVLDDFNSDCMSIGEVEEWRDYFEDADRVVGEAFPDLGEEQAYKFVDLLWQYCDRKVKAMAARLAGDITLALFHERACDRIYRELPQALKW